MPRPDNALILLLISDPDMRAALRDCLASAGYLVQSASDIGYAVDRLSEFTPHLLIIRPYINSMPGHEAVKYLRTRSPGLRVLMVGGLMDDPRLEYQMGNVHVFPRPFTAPELLEAVEKALQGGAQRSDTLRPPGEPLPADLARD